MKALNISRFAASVLYCKTGLLMNVAFLLLETSFFALGFYLISNIKMFGVIVGSWSLIVASLGIFLAGHAIPAQLTHYQII